jgi:hypothetical protein
LPRGKKRASDIIHAEGVRFAVPSSAPQMRNVLSLRRALAATRHLLEMFRRQVTNEKTRRQLQRLDQRLLHVASRLEQLGTPEK